MEEFFIVNNTSFAPVLGGLQSFLKVPIRLNESIDVSPSQVMPGSIIVHRVSMDNYRFNGSYIGLIRKNRIATFVVISVAKGFFCYKKTDSFRELKGLGKKAIVWTSSTTNPRFNGLIQGKSVCSLSYGVH
jgi:hypothetical protein